MTHQTKITTEPTEVFLEENEAFNEEMMEAYLAEQMKKDGYEIGKHNVDMLSDTEFAEIRLNTFGASDSAVLLDVAYSSKKVPRKTTRELLDEKINEDWDESIGMKPAVRKGKELEPMIIDKITELIKGKVLKPKHMYKSTHGDGLTTNFDGVVFEATNKEGDITDTYTPMPMEIKVCSFFGRSNYNWGKAVSEFEGDIIKKLVKDKQFVPGTHTEVQAYIRHMAERVGIPAYYYTQIQQQMMFLDSPHGYLAVMDDIDWTLYFYKVPRDESVIEELHKRARIAYEELLKHKK